MQSRLERDGGEEEGDGFEPGWPQAALGQNHWGENPRFYVGKNKATLAVSC